MAASHSNEEESQSESSESSDEEKYRNDDVSTVSSADVESQELEEEAENDEYDVIIELAKHASTEKEFRELVAGKIMSCKELKMSNIYKQLKESIEKYLDNGYDVNEAVLSAVRKRKYLLNRVFDEQHPDNEADGDDEEDDGEEMQ